MRLAVVVTLLSAAIGCGGNKGGLRPDGAASPAGTSGSQDGAAGTWGSAGADGGAGTGVPNGDGSTAPDVVPEPPSPPWNGVPLAALPAPACAKAPPVGTWHRRGCGPFDFVGLIVDPTNDRRQYAYTFTKENTVGLVQLVASTVDGWTTWTSLMAQNVVSYSLPTFDSATGGLFILEPGATWRWTPAGARRSLGIEGWGVSISGNLTAKPTLVTIPSSGKDWSTAIATSSDDGATWRRQEVPAAEPMEGPRDHRFFYVHGDPNDASGLWIFDTVKHRPQDPKNDRWVQNLVRTTDGGQTWKTCRAFDTAAIRFAIGGGSVVYASPFGGDTLGELRPPPPPVTLRSDDGCTQWVPLTKSCRTLSADPRSSRVYCIEHNTGILWQSRDRGETWRQVDDGNAAAIGVQASAKSAVVWGEAGILETGDDGASWRRLSSGGPLPTRTFTYEEMVSADGDLYVSSQDPDWLRIVLLRSQDGGESWAALPRVAEGTGGPARVLLPGAVVTVQNRWHPHDQWAEFLANPRTGLGYTVSMVTKDFGATWTSFITDVFNETSPSALAVAPYSQAAYAMTSTDEPNSGTLLATANAGTTWRVVNHGLCGLGQVIAADRDDPSHVYVSASDCEDGAIYRLATGSGGGRQRVPLALRAYGHSPRGIVMEIGGRVSLALGEGTAPGNAPFALAASRDGGKTWTPETAPDGRLFQTFEDLYPLASDPATPDVVHAGAYSLISPPR